MLKYKHTSKVNASLYVRTCNVVIPDKAEVENAACAATCHPAEPLDHVGTAAQHQERMRHQDGGYLKPCRHTHTAQQSAQA